MYHKVHSHEILCQRQVSYKENKVWKTRAYQNVKTQQGRQQKKQKRTTKQRKTAK